MALLLDSDICAKAVSQADTRSGAIWRAPRHEKKERSEFFKVSGSQAKGRRGAWDNFSTVKCYIRGV